MNQKKRIGIVTGASSGLGREFALQISRLFKLDELWLVARRLDRLTELAREIGTAAVAVQADLASSEGMARFLSKLREEPREIAILVNNAGFGEYGPFADSSKETLLSMIDINCRALTELSHEAIALMVPGSGIIQVASIAGFAPLGNFAVYAASKAFVLSFGLALRAELRPRGIVVTTLCPGPVATEFANVASAGLRPEVAGGKPADKVVSACLKAFRRRRALVLPYAKTRLLRFAFSLAGKPAIAGISFRFMKRPHA